MSPEANVHPQYHAARAEIARRIAASLRDVPRTSLPIPMHIAGGAALHFYTGERVSNDVDAAFSRRIALPESLEVAYADTDGTALQAQEAGHCLTRRSNRRLTMPHRERARARLLPL